MSETVIQRAWELLEKEGLSGLTPQRLTIYCEKIESDILNHCPTPLSILLLLWDHVARQSLIFGDSFKLFANPTVKKI